MIDIDKVKFDEKGLVPAVVQEANGKVLMLAYMNKESLQKTIETGYTWFYSRSRQELWNKGATSGNKQSVSEIYYDCDGDTLLVKVHQTGMACHTGTYTCFTDRRLFPDSKDLVPMAQPQDNTSIAKVLNDLYATIKDRQVNPVEGSYTNYLFEKGQDKILKKVGEECTETIIASKNMDKEEIVGLYVKEIECELLFLELIGERRQEEVERLYTDRTKRYIQRYKTMMSSKQRLLCALALYWENRPERAKEIYEKVVRKRDKYLLQGEVNSDLDIMETILREAQIQV